MATLSPASPAAHAGTTVEFRDVERRFGSMSALSGLTLRIEPGELLALLLALVPARYWF